MLTDKHASSSAITFDITGNVVFIVGSFISLTWCEVIFVFPFWVMFFSFQLDNWIAFYWKIESLFVILMLEQIPCLNQFVVN